MKNKSAITHPNGDKRTMMKGNERIQGTYTSSKTTTGTQRRLSTHQPGKEE
jgi:hypothetical protein